MCATARRCNPTRLPRGGSGADQHTWVGDTHPKDAAEEKASKPVRDVVRAYALEARATRVSAIEAMVRLKTTLAERFKGEDVSAASRADASDMRRVRRWFVEAFYFERRA